MISQLVLERDIEKTRPLFIFFPAQIRSLPFFNSLVQVMRFLSNVLRVFLLSTIGLFLYFTTPTQHEHLQCPQCNATGEYFHKSSLRMPSKLFCCSAQDQKLGFSSNYHRNTTPTTPKWRPYR